MPQSIASFDPLSNITVTTGDDPGGEPAAHRQGRTLHSYRYCEMNVWVEFWFGFDPLPTAA